LLARIDFTSGWPPTKQFDLTLSMTDPDERLRPGMSATARIAVGQLDDVLLVPSAALFYESGRTIVYRQSGRSFDAVDVEVLRRGRDQAAVSGDLEPGARVSRTRPGESAEEATP
jgi:HlyD family secretion protein